jgi:hypothetical protein
MRTVLAATTAALLFAAPAHARDRRQGIANARAAGIAVDPRAAPLMTEAPAGTCANDPTLPTCPRVHAVSYLPALGAPTFLAAAPGTTLARAAIFQCFLHVSERSPYKAVGMAQMDAQNRCSAAVTKHQLYGVLRSFKRRAWWAMAGHFNGNGKPGKTIRVAVRYKCRSRHLRAWEAHADGWSLLKGVWYAASQQRYENLKRG